MTLSQKKFHVHGDNIVECIRAFDYVVTGLGNLVCNVVGSRYVYNMSRLYHKSC